MVAVNNDAPVLYRILPAGFGTLCTEKVGAYAWKTVSTFRNPYQPVPAGFVFNGASVPRALWGLLDPAGEAFEAACVHDYLYQTTLRDKEFADRSFYLILRAYGVSEYKAEVAYRMVRRFGKGMY